MQKDPQLSILLAEVLRLQRWAGGEVISADRIFGLLHGFESVLSQEATSFGISREIQDRVEDLIEDVELGQQSAEGYQIKQWLLREDIDETVAGHVIKLCMLQGRFPQGVAMLTSPNSHFCGLSSLDASELQWLGTIHFMELVDCTEETHKKLHACFAATVPRIGEVITPENGSAMRVVDVEWVVMTQGREEGMRQSVLVPHVYLECEAETGA